VFRHAALVALGILVASMACADGEAPLRDPTQPYRAVAGPGGGSGASPRFALTGVLISPQRRVAIVNGKPYVRGETVNGAEIVRIDADAVHLRERGNDLVVPLGRAAAVATRNSQGETAQ
jgi:hypothetical protein